MCIKYTSWHIFSVAILISRNDVHEVYVKTGFFFLRCNLLKLLFMFLICYVRTMINFNWLVIRSVIWLKETSTESSILLPIYSFPFDVFVLHLIFDFSGNLYCYCHYWFINLPMLCIYQLHGCNLPRNPFMRKAFIRSFEGQAFEP